jgi:hypothetical protein
MFARFVRPLIAVVLLGSIAAPAAYATATAPDAAPASASAKTSADTALRVLESIGSIRIGASSTVVTIQNGPKTHPIVIDYGQALHTGVLGVNNDGASSRVARGDSKAPGLLPRGFTLGQIGAILLGLAVVSRVLSVTRQLIPARNRRR